MEKINDKQMQKPILLLSLSSILAGVLAACTNEQKPAKMNLEQLKLRHELASGQSAKKEVPFIVRKFEPYLDGNWIGNAVSYGCYRKGQAPGVKGPSESEILEDMVIISQYWNLIRVYSADDDTERILKVIQANSLPLRVMLGIWLENEEKNPDRKESNIAQVLRGISLTNQYSDIILAINVGNETQVFWSWHRMNPYNLIRYIRAVRNNTSTPVTTADDYNFWNKPESKIVADEIDFIVSHMYALWNGKTLENAIDWTEETYDEVQNNHPDKLLVIGETGWATLYNPAKKGPGEQGTLIKGEVSILAQEKFLIMLTEWIDKNRITTFYFEVFDEPWKKGGENSNPNEIEKHWGVFYENRTPKDSFKNYLRNYLNQ